MRISNRLRLTASVATVVIVFGQADAARAAGFALREMDADQTAHAFSGGVSEASDPSTVYGNPAGMSQIQGVQLQMDVNGIVPSVNFSGSNSITGLGSRTGTANNVVQSALTGGLALVEDELLMALPASPKHDVCPQAVKLRVADADFQEAEDKPNPFAALVGLKVPKG